ncbi:rolling circle replication-associated protein [Enterococcus casseliflavus]|uniref:rolling circle replication-associated protein n=1 Tax=Enterococcus casseliflavus TaxID=37734 RepID=UPI001586E7B5|nr:hypothetical protein [Enterococcus casseliflavus]
MKKSFVRERRVEAGPYKEIRLYSRTIEQERKCREPRGRRKKVTGLSQARWNQAQSKRKAALFLYANFGEKDYYATFTYSDQFLPEKPADAKRDQENTLKKLKRLYEKEGFELKYMWFTSYQYDEEVGYITRIHHHIVLNIGPSRDAIESVWSKGRGKKKQTLGRRQVQNIQYDSDGMQGLVNYLTGQEKWENRQWKKGQKRWSKSRNLKEPHETTNDDSVTVTPQLQTGTTMTQALLAFYGVYDSGRIPTIKNVKVELGSLSTVDIPSPNENYSEAYPKYEGFYSDTNQVGSDNPDDYKPWTPFMGPQGGQGPKGDSAPLISLSGATQAITVDKDGKITPASSFAVNGTAVNTAISNWTYSLNGGNFGSAVPTGVTRSGNIVTIDPTKAVFDTFTIKAADATVSDVFTISRIKDGGEGTPGADAYTVFLTNESYTFAGSTTAALAGSTTTQIVIYKGISKIDPTAISVGTMPTGMTSTVSGLGTAIITFTVTTAMTSKSGTVPITITADGKTFTKQFSYALSLQGATGNTGKGVAAEEISYSISQDGITPPTSGWSGTRPTPKAGWYMWTRTRFKYTDNTYSAYFYLVAQQGKDAIIISDTAPANPTKGTLWQDSSVVPQIIKVFDGTAWSMWGMPIDNLLATNILSENGVFKRLEGAEIVGSEFINPYTRSYNDGTFAQGTQRIGSAELYNSGVIKNSQGAITQSYETIFSHQFVSMARYSGSAAGDQNELIASASLSFDTLTLNDRENGFSGMIHARQLTDTPWINLSYAAGFRTSENNPCQYQISYNMKGKRTITFRGQVERTSGAMTGTTYPFGIGTVPASIRPTGNTFKLAAGDATELQTVRVAMLGTAQPSIGNSIQIKVVGNSQYVDISALTYDMP